MEENASPKIIGPAAMPTRIPLRIFRKTCFAVLAHYDLLMSLPECAEGSTSGRRSSANGSLQI
jgi:hypothetical protein